jgi:hypothetical protein
MTQHEQRTTHLGLLINIRPVPGHPLARGFASFEDPAPETADSVVPVSTWVPLHALAQQWGSAAEHFAACDSHMSAPLFQAIGMAFLALSHEESAYAHYLLVGNRLRYPPSTVAEGLEQVGADLHEAFVNWTAVGMWLERLANDSLLLPSLLEQVRSLVMQARTQQQRLWSLLMQVQAEHARLTEQEVAQKKGTPS